ncbi:MAG: serine/threonine protein kinase [Mycoplasmoidaceae bacterium]|nr:serine/threonine protein kinase [Mycoplasmoidaceae bacterium]
MDYIEGKTLFKYLEEHGCLTPKVALNIFKKLLNGVKQLHSYKQKIIHRDLKPENIMVSNDLSKVVIIDFGISSVITEEDHKVLTDEPQLFGTASYILPDLLDEYKKKEMNIPVQSDFFSLGVILYVMIMGTLPYKPIEDAKDKNGNLDVKPTIRLPQKFDMKNISANPTIPTSLENLIYRCIVSKPAEKKYRYNNIDEIIADTEKCLSIIDKKSDPTPLLKPVSMRLYQQDKLIDLELVKSNQKFFKQ